MGALVALTALLAAAPARAQQDAGAPAPEGDVVATPTPAPVIDDALRAEIDRIVEEKLQSRIAEIQAAAPAASEPLPVSLSWKGDFFTKMLVRNNQSGGCVSYGNPAPTGDNFSGDNGFCSELGLTVVGRVSDRVEAGARLQSRFGMQWADYYENGDLAEAPDQSGESLGQNHAAYLQLRGVFLRVAPPIPTVKYFHFGASDLGMFNAWTVGKLRYTERDNGRGIFVAGAFGDFLSYDLARVALPKLFAGPGYNTGLGDPLIQNPFWERDAAWAAKLRSEWEWFAVESVTSWVIDEEADTDDPDAIGSTNQIDAEDGVVTTTPRYQNVDTTLQLTSSWIDWLGLRALGGFSWSKTNDALVFDSVGGAQGFTPVPMGELFGYAAVAGVDVLDPFDIDVDLQLEYFNIGRDWVSVFGQRREGDVLLTDGFLEGQLPTLNVANEFQDFTEPFYESVIGWHGATGLLSWSPGALETSGEFTFIEYNTDTGNGTLDVDNVYPDFLYTDGMTDTELFTFANTNDRGRDPRSVYHRNQNRRTMIGVVKAAYTLDLWKGITFRAKHKTIYDADLRDPRIEGDDDYTGWLFFNKASVEAPITDELSMALGYQIDPWLEEHRSGDVVAGVATYPSYFTLRQKAFTDIRYGFAGMNLWYHLEVVNKDVDADDNRLDQHQRIIIRSLAMVTASF